MAGAHCSFGSCTDIQGECKIGNHVMMYSGVNIGQGTEIGDFVFISPYTVLTNDPTPPSDTIAGVKVGDYSQITASCVMMPGSVLGKHCLVAAHSSVNGNFDDYSFFRRFSSKKN